MTRLERSQPKSSLPISVSSPSFLGLHIIIANLAWRRLSTQVQREVSTILNISNATEVEYFGSPMSVVANWADHVRHFLPWSGPMHFIDVRDDLIEGGCHYQYNASSTGDNDSSASSDLCEFQYYHRDCVGGVCAAGAILNYSTKLIEQQHQQQHTQHEGESRLPSSSRHLRQGIVKEQKDRNYHLPELMIPVRKLCGGGNDISIKYHRFDKDMTTNGGGVGHRENLTDQYSSGSHYHSYNLHSVWDTAMIKTALERDYSYDAESQPRYEMEGALELLLANHIEWSKRYTRCQKGSGARHLECVIEWGQESWSRALKYAYTKNSPWDNDGNSILEVVSGDEIDEAYYLSRIPIVKEQLIAGAIRLAATLEDIFGRKDGTNDGNDAKHGTIQWALQTEGIRTWSYISSLSY
eukprot:CAMPEP_0168168096 /NCGR_PEP_ID=MMETSP0139_2-20121125/2892_1 /TAXON_ID=44445 /ORGANISM="Pseudo-nitzschia australis, Strain 10249 10 AB" /LENGTH=409 /DNA_ID=CAMNT_0008085365 /DNA_START=25 /DNA_END=1254 /DNA_ORIENTATION=-